MNLTEESNQNLKSNPNIFSLPSNFNTTPSNSNSLPWTQGPPQYSPWGSNPNSPPAPLVTFNAQPQVSPLAQQITANYSQNNQSNNQLLFGNNSILNSSQQQRQQHLSNQILFGNNDNQPIPSTSNFGHNIVTSNEPIPSTSYFGQHKTLLHCKRKANLDISVTNCRPSKQHITEEKMAQHMSRLHISTESQPDVYTKNKEIDVDARQKRLYVCEEMRRLQTENILPSALLGRLERPCMAVMLWQPPAKIPELIGTSQSLTNSTTASVVSQMNNIVSQPRSQTSFNLEEDENDNNAGTVDLNNMEMDS